jgi:hypothetical protein
MNWPAPLTSNSQKYEIYNRFKLTNLTFDVNDCLAYVGLRASVRHIGPWCASYDPHSIKAQVGRPGRCRRLDGLRGFADQPRGHHESGEAVEPGVGADNPWKAPGLDAPQDGLIGSNPRLGGDDAAPNSSPWRSFPIQATIAASRKAIRAVVAMVRE